jgi:hypothetical protein
MVSMVESLLVAEQDTLGKVAGSAAGKDDGKFAADFEALTSATGTSQDKSAKSAEAFTAVSKSGVKLLSAVVTGEKKISLGGDSKLTPVAAEALKDVAATAPRQTDVKAIANSSTDPSKELKTTPSFGDGNKDSGVEDLVDSSGLPAKAPGLVLVEATNLLKVLPDSVVKQPTGATGSKLVTVPAQAKTGKPGKSVEGVVSPVAVDAPVLTVVPSAVVATTVQAMTLLVTDTELQADAVVSLAGTGQQGKKARGFSSLGLVEGKPASTAAGVTEAPALAGGGVDKSRVVDDLGQAADDAARVPGANAGLFSGSVVADVPVGQHVVAVGPVGVEQVPSSKHVDQVVSGSSGIGAMSNLGSDSNAIVADGHRTLAVSPTSLEVGVQNGSHGWLRIRTEMSDGTVTASLSAASSAGQGMLRHELPSLAAFLQSEQLAVKTVIVDRTPEGAGGNSLSAGSNESRGGQRQEASAHEDSTGSGSGREDSERQVAAPWGGSQDADVYRGWNGAGFAAPAMYSSGGSWLNVRA